MYVEDHHQTISGISDDLTRKLHSSISLPRSKRSTSVYRVPPGMSMSTSLFKPRLVSLGPIHHGDPDLQAMEEVKIRYAASFMGFSTSKFVSGIKHIENELLHEYYGEDIPHFSREEEFVEIMLIDGAFFIEFLTRLDLQAWEQMDHMSQKKLTVLRLDLLLLENQLPFSLLDCMIGISNFTTNYLHYLIEAFLLESELVEDGDIDIVRVLEREATHKFHLLSIIPLFIHLPPQIFPGEKTTMPSCPTVSKLHRAGVKFKNSSSKHEGISFQGRVLEIPTLVIDEYTESFFANLLACEMCTREVHNVSDYILMMDFLIDRPEDIKLLVKHGIIENFLKDDEAASNLINSLGKNVAIYDDFCYSNTVEELNEYCRSRCGRCKAAVFEWKLDLMQNYIGNPWKLLSVIAAVVLLTFTIIQTVYSVKQSK